MQDCILKSQAIQNNAFFARHAYELQAIFSNHFLLLLSASTHDSTIAAQRALAFTFEHKGFARHAHELNAIFLFHFSYHTWMEEIGTTCLALSPTIVDKEHFGTSGPSCFKLAHALLCALDRDIKVILTTAIELDLTSCPTETNKDTVMNAVEKSDKTMEALSHALLCDLDREIKVILKTVIEPNLDLSPNCTNMVIDVDDRETMILDSSSHSADIKEIAMSFGNAIINQGNNISMSLDRDIKASLDYRKILRNEILQLRNGSLRHATSLPLQRNYAIRQIHNAEAP
jgi:hypothetical protein